MSSTRTRVPENFIVEFRRDMARPATCRVSRSPIEKTRRAMSVQWMQSRMLIVLFARVIVIGIETSDMLVEEILSRKSSRSKSAGSLRWASRVDRQR